jgi:hypothetical protein
VLRYVDISTCPPGGYTFKVEQTGRLFHAWTWAALTSLVTEHLRANDIPIPADLDARMQDYGCRTMPPGVCDEYGPRTSFFAGLRLTFSVLLEGTKAVGSWILSGKEMVSQEHADRRSTVCYSCPMNKTARDCAPCKLPVIHALIEQLIGDARSEKHDNLEGCAVCGCALKVKVWVPIQHIAKGTMNKQDYPDACWVKQELTANDQ